MKLRIKRDLVVGQYITDKTNIVLSKMDTSLTHQAVKILAKLQNIPYTMLLISNTGSC